MILSPSGDIEVTQFLRYSTDIPGMRTVRILEPAGLVPIPAFAQHFGTKTVDLFGPIPESEDAKRWTSMTEGTFI